MSDTTYVLKAEGLSGVHVGELIQFSTHLGDYAKVHALVTGELRQVYHVGGHVTLNLSSPTEDVAGSLEEYGLDADHLVRVLRRPEAESIAELVTNPKVVPVLEAPVR